jgi:hypothetical protein
MSPEIKNNRRPRSTDVEYSIKRRGDINQGCNASGGARRSARRDTHTELARARVGLGTASRVPSSVTTTPTATLRPCQQHEV